MEWLTGFISEYGAWIGVAAAVVIVFERISKLTPTQTDDKIVAWIHKIAAMLGLDFKDNPGGPGPTV